jgi:hypothetical protein
MASITPWNPEWQRAYLKRARPADGPAHFWAVVMNEDGDIISAGPAGTPTYHWTGGYFTGEFSWVDLLTLGEGKIAHAWLVGVNPDTKYWYPLSPIQINLVGQVVHKGDELKLKVSLRMFEDINV